MMKKILLLLFLFADNADIHAQRVLEPDTKSHPEWSKPIAPFKVAGNLYYVGTADLACYLIVTTEGNILIKQVLPPQLHSSNQTSRHWDLVWRIQKSY